jgi:type I restriction enzyme M protein
VITNRKAAHRKGKVQLIDGTKRFTPRRKNLGKKNADLGPGDISAILDECLAFEESETSKIFPNEAFGYWKVTVDRPLKLRVDIPAEGENPAFAALPAAVQTAVLAAASELGSTSCDDWAAFSAALDKTCKQHGVKLTAVNRKAVQAAIATRDESAKPVVKKRTFDAVEYEPDSELRDTEQIGLLEPGGIEGFFAREVLPHVPDAWIAPDSEKIGYEISFTRYFYKPKKLRSLAEIEADIRSLEAETEGLLEEILVKVQV